MADEKKLTVDDIKSREVFDSVDKALAHIGVIQDYEGFGDLQQAIVGAIDDGNGGVTLDPAIYDESMHVAIALVSEKVKGANLKPIGITVYPTPNPEAVAATPEGLAWIAKLVEKEANLVAMRPLRKLDESGNKLSFEEAAAAMPTTIASYITPQREAASGIFATYEALWREIKKLMGGKNRAWAIANFSKKELRRAFESASYAAGTYPKVEKKGGESSLFVFALNLGKLLATKQELDTTFFDNCLANRDSHTISMDDDDGELSLDDLLAEAEAEVVEAPADDEPAADESEEAATE